MVFFWLGERPLLAINGHLQACLRCPLSGVYEHHAPIYNTTRSSSTDSRRPSAILRCVHRLAAPWKSFRHFDRQKRWGLVRAGAPADLADHDRQKAGEVLAEFWENQDG